MCVRVCVSYIGSVLCSSCWCNKVSSAVSVHSIEKCEKKLASVHECLQWCVRRALAGIEF